MYKTINDFTTDWKNESESTLKILKALTDASLSQKVTSLLQTSVLKKPAPIGKHPSTG